MPDLDVCPCCGDTGWLHIQCELLASDETFDARRVGDEFPTDYDERCHCPLGRAEVA